MVEISAWWMLLAVLPVLLLGEAVVRRVELLRRFSIPVPVVGGLLVAAVVLAINLAAPRAPAATTAPSAAPPAPAVIVSTGVTSKAWMWLTTPEVTLAAREKIPLTEPFVVAFFTCIGLNASWAMARKGGLLLVWFLVLSGVLGVAQNLVGVGLCRAMGQNPLMGVLCGGVALTGGPATAMGMAPTFVAAGFKEAAVVGLSAATFGLVGGSLMGGPVAAMLIRLGRLKTPHQPGAVVPLRDQLPTETPAERDATATAAGEGEGFGAAPQGFIAEVRGLGRFGRSLLTHLLVVLACMKLGSWLCYYAGSIEVAEGQKLTFPIYMGSMVLGILYRNFVDLVYRPPANSASGRESVVRADVVEALGSVLLALFLSATMMSLNLAQLRAVAGPLAVLLGAQLLLMALFAVCVTFPLMGRTYDAAVLTAGQIGFGLGATSNAVATMEATTRRYGPSPRAFLIVTLTGGFLIDVVNIFITLAFLHVLR